MKRFLTTFSLLSFIAAVSFAKDGPSGNLHFLENKGQVKDQYYNERTDIDFKLSSGGVSVFMGSGQLHYQFHRANTEKNDEPISMYRMDVTLLNANKNAQAITEGQLPYYEQHYTTSVPVTAHSFSKITYKDVYPSIDWVLYIRDNQLEYDFIIRKGGNPADIKLQYNGATSLVINKDGSLTATTPMGSITEDAPYSYQPDGKQIASSFVLNNNILSFKTAPWKNELVIDPKLIWSTYYGGEGTDYRSSVACDNSGYVYLAGRTQSLTNIATVGSHQSSFNGQQDAFLTRFTPDGERLWATYYGGAGNEQDIVVTCDQFHNIFLAGSTGSTTNISSPGSHQETSISASENAFLAKFNSVGQRIWATYYGGDSVEHGQAVTCDDSGNVYLTGVTNSIINIGTPGTHQPVYASGIGTSSDAFLVKFDSAGVRQWGTYYGGNDVDWGFSVVADADYNVYISGQTASTNAISTGGAHQQLPGSDADAFIVKFNNSGQRIWGTYYGGTELESGFSLGLHSSDLYLLDYTASANNIATPGSFQTTYGGGGDVYLVKFDTSGTREWATYYGNTGGETIQMNSGNKVICDNTGSIYINFSTHTFVASIVSGDGPQDNFGGGVIDVVLAKFNSSGMREWATYYGTCNIEIEGGCAVDNQGNVYISGSLNSDHMATPNSHQPVKDATWDHFLAKFNNDTFGLQGDTLVCPGSVVTYYASLVPGAESYTWTLPNGWTGTSTVDTITVTVSTTSGTISVIANKSCSTEPPQELNVTVHPLPVVAITLSGNVLTATPGFVTYQWYNAAGEIIGATDSIYTTSAPGDYYVVVTDTNGCTNQSDVLPVSVEQIIQAKDVLLYPNPNNGTFSLVVTGLGNSKNVEIEIMDVTGRSVSAETYQAYNGKLEVTLDLKDQLPKGQYLLKVKTVQRSQVLKFARM